MEPATTPSVPSIGLNDDAPRSLSRDLAQSLLRICTTPGSQDRTYSSVCLLKTPNGQTLYVKSSF